jgi:hypothetical protein
MWVCRGTPRALIVGSCVLHCTHKNPGSYLAEALFFFFVLGERLLSIDIFRGIGALQR